MADYALLPEQADVKRKILNKLKTNNRVLLGAVTGFGKTIVAWDLIKTFTRKKQRVLVLTHGQREVRTNFCTSLAAEGDFIEVSHRNDVAQSIKHKIVVTLPQTIKNHYRKLGIFDYVLVDEAHQFYDAPTVQSIVNHLRKLNPGLKEVLLTATHYRFQDLPKILFSRENALESKLISNASISLVELPDKIKSADFTISNELKQTVKIRKSKLKKFFDGVVEQISSTTMKSIVVVHNVETANYVYNLLKKTYKLRKIVLSHGKNDLYGSNIDRFKKEQELNILVVVNRANIGFDCKNVKYIIDLTMTKNIERMEQIFGRVLRRYRNCKKSLIKAYPMDSVHEYKILMSGVLALSVDEVYRDWDGSYKRLPILSPRNESQGKLLVDTFHWQNGREGRGKAKNYNDFEKYIEIFNTAKKVMLNEAIAIAKDIDKGINWKSFSGCKIYASNFTSLISWRKGDKSSYNYAYVKGWHRIIAKELGWVLSRKNFTFDELISSAGKHESLVEWSRNEGATYHFAARRGWQRKIAENLGWEVNRPKNSYTYQELKDYASPHSSLTSWRKNHGGSYAAAYKKGWNRKIAKELGWDVKREAHSYTYQEINGIVKKRFDSLSSWQIGDGGSYVYAKKQGWHRKIAEELGWKSRRLGNSYTYQEVKNKASSFNSPTAWSRGHRGSYKYALKKNWYTRIYKELGWKITEKKSSYTYSEIKVIAYRFTSLSAWGRGHQSSYKFALSKCWQRKIAKSLGWDSKREHGTYTYNLIHKIASKFTSLSTWKHGHSGSYTFARDNRWQRKIATELGWKIKGQ